MKILPKLCALLFFASSILPLRADPSGLVSHWQAESNALDSVGGHHGTENSITYAPGVTGQAFAFGSSGYINVTNPPYYNYSNAFTVAAWIKRTSTVSTAPSVINNRPSANNGGLSLEQFFNAPGTMVFSVNQNGNVNGHVFISAAGWDLNTFYHVAATFDAAAGTMALYRDGVLVASTNGLPNVPMAINSAAPFEIGRNIANPAFHGAWPGLIDDARFYNHALSGAEIASLVGSVQCDWVQWTNGHYYKLVVQINGIVWSNAVSAAQAQGGYLATITSAEENAFVYSVAAGKPAAWYYNVFNCAIGPWLGGFQTNGSPEPSGGWSWITGEPFAYLNWAGGEPSNSGGTEHNVHLYICNGAATGPLWNDITDYAEVRSYMIERDTAPECTSAVATLLAASQNGIIYRYQIGQFGGITALSPITNGSLNVPAGLGVNPNGELFVASRYGVGGGNGSVSRFLDPAGTPLFNGVISNGFNTPHGVAFRGSELLAVDSWNNRVRRFVVAANGTTTELTPITTGLANTAPRYVRVAADGEVFVSQCNCGGQNDVRRFLISGETITPNGTITGNGINNPHGIVFSSSGEMFVANYDGNSISRFTFSNGVALANGTITGNGLSQPVGLTFSPWGELFAANAGAALISRWTFSANGTATANGSVSVPTASGEAIFVNSVGGEPVFVPFCTNLTVVLSAASTNCVVSTNSMTNATTVLNNIVGLWKADGNVFDASANGNHGTTHGSVTYESGVSNQAFSIPALPYAEDAAARRVELGNLPALNSATGFTVSAWVKIPPSPNPGASNDWTFIATFPAQIPNPGLTNEVLVRAFGLFATPSSGAASRRATYTLAFSDGTTATVGTTAALPDNQFAHVVVTWSSASGLLRMYRNGVLDGTTVAGLGKTLPTMAQRNPNATPLSVELGVWNFVSDTTGVLARYGGAAVAIDDFRLYTRALATNEIQLIYNGEPPIITNTVSTNCTPVDAVTTNLAFCAVPDGKLQILNASPGNVQLRWPGQTNAYYLLQGSDNISPLDWTNVWGAQFGNGSNVIVPDPTIFRPRRFYRLLSTE